MQLAELSLMKLAFPPIKIRHFPTLCFRIHHCMAFIINFCSPFLLMMPLLSAISGCFKGSPSLPLSPLQMTSASVGTGEVMGVEGWHNINLALQWRVFRILPYYTSLPSCNG